MKRIIFVLILAGLFCPAAHAAGWYTNPGDQTQVWKYRQMVTINSSNVAAALTDFPVLIKINNPGNPVFSKALPTGRDILFTLSDGSTRVTHEVESFSTAGGTLCAWVRVPALSNTVNTVLYMYYGCANSATQESRNGTWDGNFIMVQHLKETSGHNLDSTINANNSTLEAITAEGTAVGTIDGSDNFVGSSYVCTTTKNATVTAGTIAILATEIASHGATQSYLQCARITATTGRLYLLELNGTFEVGFSANAAINTNYRIPINTWHYYALTWSGANCTAYVDGVSKVTSTDAVLPAYPVNFCFGAFLNLTQQYFTGIMDEIRVSNVQRSAQWLLTEWNSMSSPQTFFSLAPEENRPSVILSENAGRSRKPSRSLDLISRLYYNDD